MNALVAFEERLQQELGAVVLGLQPVIHALAIAVVARGHVLLQGAPGLGKTLLSKSLAASLRGVFKRVQGTSDLMPSDILGTSVFNMSTGQFNLKKGQSLPRFCWPMRSTGPRPKPNPPSWKRWRSGRSALKGSAISWKPPLWSLPPKIRWSMRALIPYRKRN